MKRLDEPLTFPTCAKELGWTPDDEGSFKSAGRRLLRMILRREREIGRQFAQRDRSGRPIKVALGAVTRHFPELRPSRVDALAASLRPVYQQFERRAYEIAHEVSDEVVDDALAERVDPELQKLHDRDEVLAGEIQHLANAVVSVIPAAALPKRAPSGKPRGTTRRQSGPTG